MGVDKEPWNTQEGKKIWKNESAYWNWIRSALRRLWSDYPLRKEWKSKKLRPITQQEKDDKLFHPSTKNLGQCVYCKEWFAGSKLEVDHLISSNGCRDKESAESFLWYCGGGTGDDWVLSCKPCHKIKTQSERSGKSFQEAAFDKQAIAIQKSRQDASWLREHGISPASNAAKRRIQIVDKLKEMNGAGT